MKYLLDTDTCVDVLRGRPDVIASMQDTSPDEIAVSTVTRYELFVGVYKCRRPEREREKVAALLEQVHELALTRSAAERAAEIRATLETDGRMIGPYDVLLAGQAVEAQLRLVTGNAREFDRVPQLECRMWRR